MERLLGHNNSVYSVAFTPDRNGVVSGSLDNTTKYWDLRTLLARSEECRCLVDFTGHQDSWGLWFSSIFEVGMIELCAVGSGVGRVGLDPPAQSAVCSDISRRTALPWKEPAHPK